MITDRPSTDLSTPVKFGDVVREVNEHDRTPIENALERYIGLDHLDPAIVEAQAVGILSRGHHLQ